MMALGMMVASIKLASRAPRSHVLLEEMCRSGFISRMERMSLRLASGVGMVGGLLVKVLCLLLREDEEGRCGI
jgi:hypothetical protein